MQLVVQYLTQAAIKLPSASDNKSKVHHSPQEAQVGHSSPFLRPSEGGWINHLSP